MKRGRKPSPLTPEERFWAKVEKGPDCWEWKAFRNKGYGKFTYNGRMYLAHRLSWILTNGPIPDGLGVLHSCDNPPCVNPDHLFLGTQLDNMRDASNKGRCANQRSKK